MAMLRILRQVRSAITLLKPDEVRRVVARTPEIGLVAAGASGYAEMEDFLVPADVPHEVRQERMEHIHRAGDAGTPNHFDLVLYEAGLPAAPAGGFPFFRGDGPGTIHGVVAGREDLALALARYYLPFRKPVVDAIVQDVARENALFAVASALPNVVPSLIEMPWAVGEFVSDTAFITLNQIRMAFLVAAASGKRIGFTEQDAEVISILAGAFGWRAIARELAGKLPFGGGLVPKGAIAYAGTYVIGKGLEHFHRVGRHLTRDERKRVYRSGFEKGREVAGGAVPKRAQGTARA